MSALLRPALLGCVLMTGLVALLGCSDSSGANDLKVITEEIVFESDESGELQLHRMNADGSGRRQLTSGIRLSLRPAISPDGRRIAFERNAELYLMDPDGRDTIRVTRTGPRDGYFRWSPDGTRLVYASQRAGNPSDYDICVVLADGTGNTCLTPIDAFREASPDWSPDGQRIAFESNRDGNEEIYVMNADGSNPIRITNDPAADTHPRWSPDGTMLLFRSVRAVIGAPYIYHFATGETVPVTPDTFPQPIDAGGLNWMPDGRHIIADQLDPQQLPTNRKIVIIDRLTGGVRELTPDTTFDDGAADVRPVRGN